MRSQVRHLVPQGDWQSPVEQESPFHFPEQLLCLVDDKVVVLLPPGPANTRDIGVRESRWDTSRRSMWH
jgi:hypothetical protein